MTLKLLKIIKSSLCGFSGRVFANLNSHSNFMQNCRTVAVDMRGYGDSEKPVGIRYYRMKYLLDDVKNLIEALGESSFLYVFFSVIV